MLLVRSVAPPLKHLVAGRFPAKPSSGGLIQAEGHRRSEVSSISSAPKPSVVMSLNPAGGLAVRGHKSGSSSTRRHIVKSMPRFSATGSALCGTQHSDSSSSPRTAVTSSCTCAAGRVWSRPTRWSERKEGKQKDDSPFWEWVRWRETNWLRKPAREELASSYGSSSFCQKSYACLGD